MANHPSARVSTAGAPIVRPEPASHPDLSSTVSPGGGLLLDERPIEDLVPALALGDREQIRERRKSAVGRVAHAEKATARPRPPHPSRGRGASAAVKATGPGREGYGRAVEVAGQGSGPDDHREPSTMPGDATREPCSALLADIALTKDARSWRADAFRLAVAATWTKPSSVRS